MANPTDDTPAASAPDQELTPLSAEEEQWVRDRLAFARQDGADHLDVDSVSAFYDRHRAAVVAGEVEPEVAGVLLDVTAVLLGEHLGARYGMAWTVVRDEQGTELGLRDTLSSAVVFPQSTVGQQWNDGAEGWIPQYVEWLGGQLGEIRAATD